MISQIRFPLNVSLAVILLAIASVTTTAQRADRSLNYGFVSPNTRDNLKLEDAIRGLSSAEESSLLKRARSLTCVVKRRISTMRALGSWSDGAEHSILIRVNTDEPTIRYLMSRLGRDANQKAVIYFHPQTAGTAKMYIFQPAWRFRGFATIGRILDAAGISFRTLIPTKQGTVVYVVDTERSLTGKVKAAATRLRARVKSQTGNANFIGDDAVREKGQTIFANEIKEYESKHPQLSPPCEVK
ncbi:MAG TPA: hypothetical protein VGQ39_17835 [Pyrinomonadaceae bacterium]|jgi:hypothetical protein|nr:hypothetical protein [Pyrinomonadaceae bacterium]